MTEDDWSERLLTHFVGGRWRVPLSCEMGQTADGLMLVRAGAEDFARARDTVLAARADWLRLPRAARLATLAPWLPVADVDPAPQSLPPIALIEAARPGPHPAQLAPSLAATLAAALGAGQGAMIVSDPADPRPACRLLQGVARAPWPAGLIALLHGDAALAQAALR